MISRFLKYLRLALLGTLSASACAASATLTEGPVATEGISTAPTESHAEAESAAPSVGAPGATAALPRGPVVEYEAAVVLNASTGATAPYMIGSWRNGRQPYKNGALLDVGALKRLDHAKRLDWEAGVELLTGYAHGIRYERFNNDAWTTHTMQPARFWVQQLYATLKYRSLFITVGQRDHHSALLDDRLSSGDLVRSCNARGIPEVEAGFIDFQNIPFTNGWVQIEGVIGYGKFMDNSYSRNQFNYYYWVLATDTYYTYKRCYFRTKPSQPLSITVGMQAAGQFGGMTQYYNRGKLTGTDHRGFKVSDLWDMFFPISGNGESWIKGNSLGSWDFKARYRLPNGHELSAAFEWPWEDGSGIGRRNGWDGLWGLYYHAPGRAAISGAAIEYLDFTNQSGPLHWAPGDHPGTTITSALTGGDNYYNNDQYGAYDNLGLSIGSPFLKSPLYNLDGAGQYVYTRSRGFHAAVEGALAPQVDWRVMASYQKAWGNGRQPSGTALHNTSLMAEATWQADRLLKGLGMQAVLAVDAGSLRGHNFGAMLTISYKGNFSLR